MSVDINDTNKDIPVDVNDADKAMAVDIDDTANDPDMRVDLNSEVNMQQNFRQSKGPAASSAVAAPA